jgi:hypothetical protein
LGDFGIADNYFDFSAGIRDRWIEEREGAFMKFAIESQV